MTTTFMSSPKLLFTSESVTEGHPDRLCDMERFLQPGNFLV
jgi:S-adenosylmethionine synthetase